MQRKKSDGLVRLETKICEMGTVKKNDYDGVEEMRKFTPKMSVK